MRRLFALLLIATSGWLLYQTATHHLGAVERLFSNDVLAHRNDLAFVMPALGGALGLLGGLTVFFNGPGGAALAMAGGLAAAGFTLTLKQTFELEHVLDNELAVGASMLMLAIMTGSITRVTRRSRKAAEIDDLNRQHASGRRVF
jgi:uncharacterized membrane protein YjjB (DUF3815 family)